MAASQSWVLPAGWNDAETHRTGGGFEFGPLKMRFVYPCADGHVSITFLFGNALGPSPAASSSGCTKRASSMTPRAIRTESATPPRS